MAVPWESKMWLNWTCPVYSIWPMAVPVESEGLIELDLPSLFHLTHGSSSGVRRFDWTRLAQFVPSDPWLLMAVPQAQQSERPHASSYWRPWAASPHTGGVSGAGRRGRRGETDCARETETGGARQQQITGALREEGRWEGGGGGWQHRGRIPVWLRDQRWWRWWWRHHTLHEKQWPLCGRLVMMMLVVTILLVVVDNVKEFCKGRGHVFCVKDNKCFSWKKAHEWECFTLFAHSGLTLTASGGGLLGFHPLLDLQLLVFVV